MIEGWYNDHYLILFEKQEEVLAMTARYGASEFLPGFTVLGIKGWDDFILRDTTGQCFTAPTLPLVQKHLTPFTFAFDLAKLRPDERLAGKIKWYIQPIVFGGDPQSEKNIAWITLDQHAQAVKWWNQKYQELK